MTKRRKHAEPRRYWTAKEDMQLRRRYPHELTALIAMDLDRSLSSTHQRATTLGLHKTESFRLSPAACRLRRGDKIGFAWRFPKGNVPHNKGLRRPGWHTGRMQQTQFKAGVPSWRTMPIGATREVGGYVYRKMTETRNVPWTKNWMPEHVRVWVAAHGPLPAKHCVVFRDGNRHHTALENLECISRKALMARNTIHHLPPALAETIRLLVSVKRTIKRRSRDVEEH